MVPKVRQNVVVVMSRTDVVTATWTLTFVRGTSQPFTFKFLKQYMVTLQIL
ncbi:hypothetical protein ANAPH1_00145 [Anaplasma phagocytophilum]|nr:hypothetical protein ANAPH1_00145 [Anaplasma phagocytophilum]